MRDPRQRLIVALDVPAAAAARKIVAAVGDSVLTYKVGMQLYTAEGPGMVRDLVASGRQVFLDLKYHDIPNTVAAAVREGAADGPRNRPVADRLAQPDAARDDHSDAADPEAGEVDAGLPVRSPDDQHHPRPDNRLRAHTG